MALLSTMRLGFLAFLSYVPPPLMVSSQTAAAPSSGCAPKDQPCYDSINHMWDFMSLVGLMGHGQAGCGTYNFLRIRPLTSYILIPK